MRDFISLSRYECKISVARYLFTPEEVVERIIGQLRTSKGVPDLDRAQPSHISDDVAHTLELLPRYEAEILRRLSSAPIIYWVAEATSSEINSLVEYPLTTVVLVVKPPGSALEFEIKRAGRRRGPALGVVYERNGSIVPPPHRLDGGSMLSFLRHEASRRLDVLNPLSPRARGGRADVPYGFEDINLRRARQRRGGEHT